ncbi:gliding motility-associated C-terminal domain-containing protein, partial [Algoriphagus namhaensis]
TVTNTGNVTLSDVTVEDPLTGLNTNVGDLAPGESATVVTSYTITQADVDAGSVTNAATGTGQTPDGGGISGGGQVTVPAGQVPSIEILKEADKSSVSEVGEVITYTLTVTNTGNVALTDVSIEDPKLSYSENIGDLGVGESQQITLTYIVTISDILDQGDILNVAEVDGTFESLTVEAEDGAVVSILCDDRTLLTGIVFNEDNSTPLANVPVMISEVGSESGVLYLTDSEGRFTATDIPEGDYRVQVIDRQLNKVERLFASNGNTQVLTLTNCDYTSIEFPYSERLGGLGTKRVIEGFVWYDLNGDGIENEWFDANNDGIVSENPIVPGGQIDLNTWEWFDFNGDGRYDGPENEGELNRAGFGNPNGQNLEIQGPNGYVTNETVSQLGYWTHVLPGNVPFGEFTITLEPDAEFAANGFTLASSGLVKVLPESDARMTQVNEIFCEFTTPKTLTQIFSATEPNDFDFGLRCLEGSPNEIIANDDLFGEFFLSFGGVLGNILDNDLLAGQRPNSEDVEITITDVGGLLGISVDANGDLVLLPGLNPVGTYTLTYTLGEVAFPDNTDDAIIVITIINDQVDLGVEKTSFEAEIYEGDEFVYEVVLSNLGDTDAREVTLVDDLPQNLTYLSSEVTSNASGAEVSLAVTGSRLTWTIPFFEADATITFNILVKAGDPGLITNTAEVDSPADDINELNDVDDDVNEILPFRIPNVITPGKIDGDNDIFEILGIGKFVSNDIVIFNRYGDHVLETENYQNDWDAPGQVSGTYFYIFTGVDKDGKVHEFRGWIQVIKE